ncbi:hypothetical protein [Novosphingobium sp. SG916]|nr:DNA polymerase III alpha subunit [Novosphingobium sp. SG916]
MKDGRWINLVGLVLVHQKPGSAKGVMFITLEDEAEIANLVVWTNVFGKHLRVVLGASMMGVRGQVHREGDVIHVIAQRRDDLSSLLASVGNRSVTAGVYQVSRADIVKHGMRPDPRNPAFRPLGQRLRDMFDPLCRARHNGSYAEGETMPTRFGKSRDFR